MDQDLYNWTKLNREQEDLIRYIGPQRPTLLVVNETAVCVARVGKDFLAISDICPHAGASLHKGHCNRQGVIVCPLHHYKFDMKNGRSADGSEYHLKTYKVRVEDDGIFIGERKF